MGAYSQSKLANVLFSKELSKRLEGEFRETRNGFKKIKLIKTRINDFETNKKPYFFVRRNGSASVQSTSRRRTNRIGQNNRSSVLSRLEVHIAHVPLSVAQNAGTRSPNHSTLFDRRKSWRGNWTLLQVRCRLPCEFFL